MRLTAMTMALTLLVSACGGSGAGTTAGPTTTTVTTAPATTVGTGAATYESDDGRLTIDAPAGTPALTISAADTSDVATADGFEVIAAYDVSAAAELADAVAITLDTGLDAADGFFPLWAFVEGDDGVWVSAFVHDGTFAPEVSAGDVSGADPTEPLQPIPVLDQ